MDKDETKELLLVQIEAILKSKMSTYTKVGNIDYVMDQYFERFPEDRFKKFTSSSAEITKKDELVVLTVKTEILLDKNAQQIISDYNAVTNVTKGFNE